MIPWSFESPALRSFGGDYVTDTMQSTHLFRDLHKVRLLHCFVFNFIQLKIHAVKQMLI